MEFNILARQSKFSFALKLFFCLVFQLEQYWLEYRLKMWFANGFLQNSSTMEFHAWCLKDSCSVSVHKFYQLPSFVLLSNMTACITNQWFLFSIYTWVKMHNCQLRSCKHPLIGNVNTLWTVFITQRVINS